MHHNLPLLSEKTVQVDINYPEIKNPGVETGIFSSGEQDRTADLRVMNPAL